VDWSLCHLFKSPKLASFSGKRVIDLRDDLGHCADLEDCNYSISQKQIRMSVIQPSCPGPLLEEVM